MSVERARAGSGSGSSGSSLMAAAPDPQQQPLLSPPSQQQFSVQLAGFASDNPALSTSSSTASSSTTSSRTRLSDDGGALTSDTALTLEQDGGGGDSFSVCKMKTVSVSSLLMPSPCFIVALLLLPPVIGFLIYLFVEFFVPVLVQILMDM